MLVAAELIIQIVIQFLFQFREVLFVCLFDF